MASPVKYKIEGMDAVVQFDKHPTVGSRFDIHTGVGAIMALEVVREGTLKQLVTFKIVDDAAATDARDDEVEYDDVDADDDDDCGDDE